MVRFHPSPIVSISTTSTLANLKEQWESQGGICPITGVKLILRTHTCQDKLQPYHASLDRIDSSLGYMVGNIRFIAIMANFAKNVWSDDDLIDFCKKVAKQHDYI